MKQRVCTSVLGVVGLALLGGGGHAALAAAELPEPAKIKVDFANHIAPVFKRCVACHGAKQQMNGLRLDDSVAAMQGGYSGPAIVPGNSAESLLVKLIAGLEEERKMPPAGKPVSREEVALVRAWIDQGAMWDKPAQKAASAEPKPEPQRTGHWAFQPIARPQPPTVTRRAWLRNPIDAFVLSRLEDLGIQPSPEASKETLLRRAAFDLTGLPPTPQEVAAFVADNRPDAYERAVDKLLASPHYAEKWARHWLDVARYADSDGYEKDYSRPHAWRYRQWVIDALHRDMPFDQFTLEQIAGDLLPGGGVEQKVATGFHRNTLKNREGGVNGEQFRFEETVDRVNTVGSAWMGLTVACAQCHDHKYDPISQKDYYRLYAYFNSVRETQIDAPLPGEMGPYLRTNDAFLAKRQELLDKWNIPDLLPPWEEQLRQAGENPGKWTGWDIHYDTFLKMTDNAEEILATPAEKRTFLQQENLLNFFLTYYSQVASRERWKELKFGELKGKLAELRETYPRLSQAMVIEATSTPRPTRLHVQGQWDREGIPVEPGTPVFLPSVQTEPSAPPRLALARWLLSEKNPLTARVVVNRFWQEFFGSGLVATAQDFGTQGEPPSHPDLLDWLATEFREQGWSMKALHRTIATSATYRQSSAARPDLISRDPGNRLLARQQRLRLPAELVRDAALSASGLLNPEIGGKSVRPPLPEGVMSLAYDAAGIKWVEQTGPERYRRGMYIHFQRTVPYPFLMTFDVSDSNVSTCSRSRSNTPLQALNLLNDPVFLETAQGLAARLMREAQAERDFAGKLAHAFRLCLGRDPGTREREELLAFYQKEKEELRGDEKARKALWPASVEGVDEIEAAAWTSVSRVLLNLDEFITRE